jgi:hypothetical protein
MRRPNGRGRAAPLRSKKAPSALAFGYRFLETEFKHARATRPSSARPMSELASTGVVGGAINGKQNGASKALPERGQQVR